MSKFIALARGKRRRACPSIDDMTILRPCMVSCCRSCQHDVASVCNTESFVIDEEGACGVVCPARRGARMRPKPRGHGNQCARTAGGTPVLPSDVDAGCTARECQHPFRVEDAVLDCLTVNTKKPAPDFLLAETWSDRCPSSKAPLTILSISPQKSSLWHTLPCLVHRKALRYQDTI